MDVDGAVIQDYAAGRLDAGDRLAVERAARRDARIAEQVRLAIAVTSRVQRRLAH